MSFIPLASTECTWNSATNTGAAELQVAGSAGCRFPDRCPHATVPYLQAAPLLFPSDRYRAVACYLYQSAPTLAVAELGRRLRRRQGSGVEANPALTTSTKR